jgi:hypothetical protein
VRRTWATAMTIVLGAAASGGLAPAPLHAQTNAWKAETRAVGEKKAKPQKPVTLKQDRTALSAFATAPFPYEGMVPATGKQFLDVEENERRGHTGMRGQVFWADEVYDDNRVLLHIPKSFDAQKPGMIVVFFHGHGATLERDVLRRQQVADQISRAGVNAVLIAPQFARDAADSSAGRFWEPGKFQHFIDEAQKELARLYGDKRAEKALQRMPLVFVAYSGGYLPAAFALHHGGATKRVKAVLLLDGLYGDVEKYTNWISRYRSGIFVSAHTHLTADRNATLMKTLTEKKIPYEVELKTPLLPGTVAFVPTGVERRHRDFVTDAWAELPVREFLRALTAKK